MRLDDRLRVAAEPGAVRRPQAAARARTAWPADGDAPRSARAAASRPRRRRSCSVRCWCSGVALRRALVAAGRPGRVHQDRATAASMGEDDLSKPVRRRRPVRRDRRRSPAWSPVSVLSCVALPRPAAHQRALLVWGRCWPPSSMALTGHLLGPGDPGAALAAAKVGRAGPASASPWTPSRVYLAWPVAVLAGALLVLLGTAPAAPAARPRSAEHATRDPRRCARVVARTPEPVRLARPAPTGPGRCSSCRGNSMTTTRPGTGARVPRQPAADAPPTPRAERPRRGGRGRRTGLVAGGGRRGRRRGRAPVPTAWSS